MISLAVKSRQCLIDDIKCLEIKLLHLQGRFDVIANWIRSQYFELSGLPDYVKIAVSEDDNGFEKAEHVKVECDTLEDSFDLNADDEIDTESQLESLFVKVDDDLRNIEYSDLSTTDTTDPSALPIEKDIKLEKNDDRLIGGNNKTSCNETVTKGHTKRKRIIKTAKHVQANKEKCLILDAVQHKEMTSSLPPGRSNCVAQSEKNFLCNQCGQAFSRKYTLQIHIAAVHAKRKDFKCQFCEKSFTVENVKNNHEKKHLGMLSVTCDLCGFSFTCKQILRKHIRGVHQNHRPFQCQLCDKRFKTSHARNYHVNTHGNPNGRKRGLNREVDPIRAAAKRRNCIVWKNNRIHKVTSLDTTLEEEKSSNATDVM